MGGEEVHVTCAHNTTHNIPQEEEETSDKGSPPRCRTACGARERHRERTDYTHVNTARRARATGVCLACVVREQLRRRVSCAYRVACLCGASCRFLQLLFSSWLA